MNTSILHIVVFIMFVCSAVGGEKTATDLAISLRGQFLSEIKKSKTESPRRSEVRALFERFESLQENSRFSDRASKWLDRAQMAALQRSLEAMDLQSLATDVGVWTERRNAELAKETESFINGMGAAAWKVTEKLFTASKSTDLDSALAALDEELARNPSGITSGATSWSAYDGSVLQLRSVRDFARAYQSILASAEDGNRLEAIEQFERIQDARLPGCKPSDLLRLLDNRRKALGIPILDEIEATGKKLVEKALATQNAADLDSPLDELYRWKRLYAQIRTRDSGGRSAESMLGQTIAFVAGWQEVIALRGSGKEADARSKMQAIASRLTMERESIVPRSKLLELANPPKPAPEVKEAGPSFDSLLGEIRTLEDLESRFTEINDRAKLAGGERVDSTIIIDLQGIATAWRSVRSGSSEAGMNLAAGGFNRHPKVAELRAQLQLRAVAASLFADGELSPKKDESIAVYLERQSKDAFQRGDWPKLQKAFELKSRCRLGTSFPDNLAIQNFVGGKNLEAAGIYPSAVRSYVNALKQNSAYVPVDAIKARIAGIQKEHPEDYRKGVELAESTQAPNEK